jgi:hypothetical protein
MRTTPSPEQAYWYGLRDDPQAELETVYRNNGWRLPMKHDERPWQGETPNKLRPAVALDVPFIGVFPYQ